MSDGDNSTPSNSPFLKQGNLDPLLKSPHLSLQSLDLLKSSSRLLRRLADPEISLRNEKLNKTLVKDYIESSVIIQSDPSITQTLIEACNYVTLIKTKQDKPIKSLEIKIDSEIQRRDQRIAEFLEDNMVDNPLDGISIAIDQKNSKIAADLIGKYLYKSQGATSSNANEWKESREFCKKRFDGNNTILHLVAAQGDPELVISICWTLDKAILDARNRYKYFMVKNDAEDNPVHHAFKLNKHKSALTLAKGMSKISGLSDCLDLIMSQTGQDGITTKECLKQSKEIVSQPPTPNTVRKPSNTGRS